VWLVRDAKAKRIARLRAAARCRSSM
jgi:hypothetical protein